MEYDTIISGNIGSGQIGGVHIADGSLGSGAIGSGSIGQFQLSSGAVNSGHIASGAVFGFLGGFTARTIASGSIGAPDIGASAIVSGAIAGGAVLGSIASGNIASGTIGPVDIASGAVTSGRLGVAGAPDGTKFLRDDFSWVTPTPTIGSGSIGSGAIASGAVQGFFGATRDVASGTLGVFDFGSGAVVAGAIGSGAVVSGNIASGQVGQSHLASGAVTSGAIASGQVSQFKLASGAVNSGAIASGAVVGSLGGGARTIASGTIGPNELGSGSVLSGVIASGQVGTFHISSGTIVTYSRNVILDQYKTSETVSGVRCVQFDPTNSGAVRMAMASVSGRIPSDGVAFANALSGQAVTIVRFGEVLGPSSEIGSGLAISGRAGGKSLWLGASGQVVVLSGGGPTIGVGATNSGAWGQRIGSTSTSGGVLIDIVPFAQFSGAANITTNFQQWPV